MDPYVKLSDLDSNRGIWRFNSYLRVTFVHKGWLIVWDHRDHPPARYDCKADNHREACLLATKRLRELAMLSEVQI